jgi:hypothetical protein
MILSKLRWYHLSGLMLMTCALLFAGCAGDDGSDGTDGAAGPTGPSGTATCMECHTDSWDTDNYLAGYLAEYGTSTHANGGNFVRKGASCAICHTTEGFQAVANGGTLEEDLAQSSAIGCFACHAPHTNETFALRTTAAVTLNSGGTFDFEEANLCANCHQGRPVSPAVDDAETAITSIRWGAHHGPQANIFSGDGLWEIGDATYDTTSPHSNITNACVNCHMAPVPGSGMAGGHTFGMEFEYHGAMEINSAGCTTCHDGWDDEAATEYVEDAMAEFDVKLATLKALLMEAGWLDDSNYVVTDNAPTDADSRGAILNYNTLREDRSGGIHNFSYAKEAIDASIAYMEAL